MLIEEVENFNKRNLSFEKIIFSKYKLSWKIFAFSLLFIGIILPLIWFFLLKCNLIFIWLLIPAFALLFYFIKYVHKKTFNIIRSEYPKIYKLNIDKTWNSDTINLIRISLIREFLSNNKISKTEDIKLIINSLKYENSSKIYYFQSWGIALVLVGVFLDTFLSSILNYANGFDDLIEIAKPISVIILMIIMLFVFVEKMIVKEYFLYKKNKRKRLIRTLENYLLNLNDT